MSTEATKVEVGQRRLRVTTRGYRYPYTVIGREVDGWRIRYGSGLVPPVQAETTVASDALVGDLKAESPPCPGCKMTCVPWDPPYCCHSCRAKAEGKSVGPANYIASVLEENARKPFTKQGPMVSEIEKEAWAAAGAAMTQWMGELTRALAPESPIFLGADLGYDADNAVTASLAPLLAAPVRREVSTNGRDYVDYDRMVDPDPFGSYPHWKVWRGADLVSFRTTAVMPLTCVGSSMKTESGVCGAPAAMRVRYTGPKALCDACYLDHETNVTCMTALLSRNAREQEHMDRMDRNVAGLGAPEPRTCSPILAGGVFNLRSGR